MEGAVVNNLIVFDSPPEGTVPSVLGPPSGVGFFSFEPLVPEPASDATMEPLLPEPIAPTHTSHREEDSDATESADSDNEDTESPSHPSSTRRSSSCSSHSAEDAEETEIRAFMKTYVAKLFHGRWFCSTIYTLKECISHEHRNRCFIECSCCSLHK